MSSNPQNPDNDGDDEEDGGDVSDEDDDDHGDDEDEKKGGDDEDDEESNERGSVTQTTNFPKLPPVRPEPHNTPPQVPTVTFSDGALGFV